MIQEQKINTLVHALELFLLPSTEKALRKNGFSSEVDNAQKALAFCYQVHMKDIPCNT